MKTPARILRARIDEAPGPRRYLSNRDLDRRDRILQAGCLVLAEFGRHAITMASFALGLGLSPGTVRRLFPDLDNLLGEIIRQHLRTVSIAVCAVPQDVADRPAAQRAAYIAATRTSLGAPAAAQLLLMDRRLLPPDERASIEAARDTLADILGGPHGMLILDLLDMACLSPAQIEATVAILAPAAPAEAAPERISEPPAEMAASPAAVPPLAATTPPAQSLEKRPSLGRALPPPWRPGPQQPRAQPPDGSPRTRPDTPPGKSLYQRALASLP
jgi:AcrR family transcriptional regulator